MVRKELLDILWCPRCHGGLTEDPRLHTLTCQECGAVYPVKDNVPILVDHGT